MFITMKYLAAFAVFIGGTTLGQFSFSAEQLTEAAWTELADDTSRATLFADEIIPARLASDASGDTSSPIDLALPKEFWFPDDASYDKMMDKIRENVVFGVDISHHSGKINFKNLRLQKIDFVYAKATQGVRFKDGKFGSYWDALGALDSSQKVFRGAYHFLSANGSAEDQANSFVDYVALHGGLSGADLPPCLDLEWDRTSTNPDQWNGQSPEAIITKALRWMKIVEQRTGRKPILYTARSWWRERLKDENLIRKFDGYRIWIADYSTSHKAVEKPAVIHDVAQAIWQFADDARLSTGYDRGMDANIFYGTLNEFKSTFEISE